MIKIGLSSYSLSAAVGKGEMDIFDLIRFVAEHGGEHLEIVPSPAYPLSDDPALLARVVDAAREAGIELSSYTIGANFIQPDETAWRAEVDRVKKEVDVARKLGVTRMRHDAGGRSREESTCANFEKDLPAIVRACREIADYALPHGIVTSVENHGFHFQASERVQRLVLAVDRPNFRTTLDVGNFLCVDEDPEIATRNNIGFASMIHFKDFHVRRDPPRKEGYIATTHGRYLRPALTGDGDINLPAIVDIINEAGYDGFLSIEFEGWEECRMACARALDNVRALFGQTAGPERP